MFRKIILFIIVGSVFSTTFAYTPSESVEQNAVATSERLAKYLSKKSTQKVTKMIKTLTDQLPALQLRLLEKGEVNRAYHFEYIRRHLPGTGNIDTPDLIDDDTLGFTWTHAPRGFDVVYTPYETPKFVNIDMADYSTLINAGYFKRTEGGYYHAGVLYMDGYRQTPFEAEDPHLTHIACIDDLGFTTFWTNSDYSEERLSTCRVAFQAGPMIYARVGEKIDQDLRPKTYLGGSHARTVMVVFTRDDDSQDTWFLTTYHKKTLSEIRDIVLSEMRFYGEYRDVHIFNLDGGSSVAYRSRDFSGLDFGQGKTLPVVFGIK